MQNQKSKIKNQKQVKSVKIFWLLVLNLALIFALCSLHLARVNAQTTTLSLWPSLAEMSLKPGQNVTQSYKLTNNSDRKLEIVPQIIPFLPDGESGKIKLTPLSEKQPARPEFFSFDGNLKFNEPFSIDIGQTKEIILKIAIPRSTLESDYYYTLLFGTETIPPENGNSKIDIASQIGANFLLSIYATSQPSYGGIAEFSVPQIVDSLSPVNFVVRLENSGRSFWKPLGQITVSGLFNQKNEVKLLEQNILANSTRKLTIGSFKPKLPIGLFKAKIEFTLNKTGEKLYKEIEFWYVPYKAAFGMFLALLLIKVLKRLKK